MVKKAAAKQTRHILAQVLLILNATLKLVPVSKFNPEVLHCGGHQEMPSLQLNTIITKKLQKVKGITLCAVSAGNYIADNP
jgi:hypothetical protein